MGLTHVQARATSPVILGESGDAALLVTLETLGLMLDPPQRKLLPMRMLVAGARGGR